MESKAELSAAVTAAMKAAYEREVETATAIAWAVRAATMLGLGSSRASIVSTAVSGLIDVMGWGGHETRDCSEGGRVAGFRARRTSILSHPYAPG